MSKRSIRIISVVLAILMILSVFMGVVADLFSANANNKTKLAQLRKELSEVTDERKTLEEELKQLNEEKKSLLEQKTTTEMQINATMEQIDIATAIIEELTLQINERTVELETAVANEEQQYATFKTRVRAMYENDSLSTLELVLSSGSLTEVYNKLEASAAIAEHDKKLMKNLAETRQYISDLKTGLEEDKSEQEEIKEEFMILQQDLISQTEELERLITEIIEQEEYTQADIDTVKKAEAEFEKEIAQIVAAIAKAEEEARRKAEEEARKKAEAAKLAASKNNSSSSGSSGSYSGGSMAWPLPGYSKISSYFEMRDHPVTGVYGQHSGIDIPAPKGTKAYACAPGTVVSVGYNAVFGNRVIVSHGNGYQTLYAHFSSIAVKENQQVTTDTVIGYVGSTGQSTGNHLHLSVRKNGSYVNPLNYVSP